MLGPNDSEGAGGTRAAEEVGDVGSGVGTSRTMDAGIWGSSIGTAGRS